MNSQSPTIETEPRTGSNGNGDHAHQGHSPVAPEHALPSDLPKPSNVTVIVIVIVFALLLVGMFAIGFFPRHHLANETEATAQQNSSALPVVQVQAPKSSGGVKEVILPADVRAYQQTDLYPRANGYLKQWNYDIQDHVEQGQVMAIIEEPEVDAQLKQGQAQLELNKAAVVSADADLKLADITLKRFIEAQKSSPGSVTQEDIDTKQSAYDVAVAALAQSKASVAASEANVQQLATLQGFEKVYAPFSGTVTARNYDNGALLNPTNIGPGKQIFSMAETDVLRVWVYVPQPYSTNIHTGQKAYLKVERNYPGREFEGTVARTAGTIDPNTRTLAIQLTVPNKDGSLYAGMYAEARIPLSDQSQVLLIPTSALVFNANGLHVAVIKQDQKVHLQEVKVGRDLGTQIEITGGLSTDDQVVTNPGERIAEGVQVKIVPLSEPGQPADQKKPAVARATP
jgi:RND family efflux transporter MFP subunit